MLVAVRDLAADAETSRRGALARWLHNLNPGAEYWNPVRPDPLADQLLADLDLLPDLVDRVVAQALDTVDYPTLERLLAELTRAAAASTRTTADSGTSATTALGGLLTGRLSDLVDCALGQPGRPLPQRLTAALQQNPVPIVAATVADRLPERSTALAELAAEVATQVVTCQRDLVASDIEALPDLAGSLNNQSNRLRDVGRREDALTAIEEAVKIRRELAAARPDAFLPDLAGSLNNQSNRLRDVGRREDALTAIEESVKIYGDLGARHPIYREAHAQSLAFKRSLLTELGDSDGAR
jgi:tetratricopeptide (TPR) repeat protein